MYRVKFQFKGQRHGYYYSEWFETPDEADDFVKNAEGHIRWTPENDQD